MKTYVQNVYLHLVLKNVLVQCLLCNIFHWQLMSVIWWTEIVYLNIDYCGFKWTTLYYKERAQIFLSNFLSVNNCPTSIDPCTYNCIKCSTFIPWIICMILLLMLSFSLSLAMYFNWACSKCNHATFQYWKNWLWNIFFQGLKLNPLFETRCAFDGRMHWVHVYIVVLIVSRLCVLRLWIICMPGGQVKFDFQKQKKRQSCKLPQVQEV